MLRWGILPTLVWHYSVDAMYSAMLLLRSHSLYFKLSGAASAGIIVLPVLVALVAYWRRGGFEPETGLLNARRYAAAAEPPPSAGAHETAVEAEHGCRSACELRIAAGVLWRSDWWRSRFRWNRSAQRRGYKISARAGAAPPSEPSCARRVWTRTHSDT